MKDKRNYNLLRIIFYIHAEKIHRLVFDSLYLHDYKIKLKDKPLLNYHKLLCRIIPEYRPYLKYWKGIITRAYSQKRANLINYCIYWKLNNVNTDRYSSYFE